MPRRPSPLAPPAPARPPRVRPALRLAALLLTALLLSACGTYGPPLGGAPGAGATPGGVQDMALARELVRNGVVPPAEAFVVEGMFSEHDLPLDGAACARLLCLRGGLGIAPTLDGNEAGWVQIGLSSTIDLGAYERPPLSLVFVVDVSGSMGWRYATAYDEYQTPLTVAKGLMERLVPTLDADDELAIVVYGSSSRTVLEFTPGDRHARILDAVEALASEGSTNMERGLQTAYRLAGSADAGRERRLLLFTDVQPNVGATSATEFERLVQEGAAGGIGLTVFGVGVGLGPEVMDAMSRVRGGNAFTLFGSREVEKVMTEDWPFLASPIAYDLTLALEPEAGLRVADGYGFPTSGTDADGAELKADSVFLSRRRGALLVRLAPEAAGGLDAGLAVTGSLSYETPAGEVVSERLEGAFRPEALDARGQAFEQPAIGKTVALAILVSAMREAAEAYGEGPETAVATMERALERFRADAESLSDEALEPEVAFAETLLELMRSGADQGTLYGAG